MKIHMLILGLMIAVLMAGCGSSDKNDSFGTSSSNYVLTAGKSSSNYVLTAWNDLGMHCMDGNDFSVFSILPPYNNLHAQLKKKNGDLVTRGVTITFESTT
ncbi:MAG: hypothetical protein LGB71_04700, partial [Sulfurovum sp.]|nr:hypothetical protein [Sulfurovum sp.]MCB4758032.1 hypothetical protein [Sulfurovum sp.]MCB4765887.1 hypothetical protein [Sulfurovum sp.]MCB4774565.1 hypothetical protein [Sulfurovum sp.]MCB4781901.1 hypothetical protein [Sulfurovum sp.]